MKRRFDQRFAILMTMLFLCSSGAFAQEYPPSFPSHDAKMVLDNEAVAVWDVTWEKGKPTPMQECPLDQLSVTLNEGAVKVTKSGGTWAIEEETFGSVRLESKGTVEAKEGVSEQPSRQIIFQLKDYAPHNEPIIKGIPGQFPRPGATKLFETDRIIVWDTTWKELSQLHAHYTHTAAVFIQGGTIHSFSPQGEGQRDVTHKAGDVIMGSLRNIPHQEQQIEGSPRAIWIEFK
jgi:hypothetical protein